MGQEDKRPANALIAKMVEVCEAKGISHLIYGLYNYGNKRNSSLLEFKIRNGFEEFLVPRYYIPLTTIRVRYRLNSISIAALLESFPTALSPRRWVSGRNGTLFAAF